MPKENKIVELSEELEKVAGGTNQEIVKVEIYCKDCDKVIYSWHKTNGAASAGRRQITICNYCGSENIGRREILVQ